MYSSGIQTKRDGLCVHFDAEDLWAIVRRFHALTATAARQEFNLGEDGRDWTVAGAKADIAASGPNKQYITSILYRPFDIRHTYWTGQTKGFLAYPRREVMQHVIGRRSVGMIFNRQVVGDNISHFGVSRFPICHGTFYLGNKGQDYFAPLYVLAGDDSLFRSQSGLGPNFTPKFAAALNRVLGARATDLTPEDIFHYVYAVFHSPGYRSRYAEFLKIDFPRLPLTSSLDLFRSLSRLGSKLVALHLMESPKLDKHLTKFVGKDDNEVVKVRYEDETVWINPTQGFQDVPENVWNFHIGGYQVCEKWLKDRKGRTLSKDDIEHYHRIVVALHETIRLMAEIDTVIDAHCGWPLK